MVQASSRFQFFTEGTKNVEIVQHVFFKARFYGESAYVTMQG